jgi:hypothetical protein
MRLIGVKEKGEDATAVITLKEYGVACRGASMRWRGGHASFSTANQGGPAGSSSSNFGKKLCQVATSGGHEQVTADVSDTGDNQMQQQQPRSSTDGVA